MRRWECLTTTCALGAAVLACSTPDSFDDPAGDDFLVGGKADIQGLPEGGPEAVGVLRVANELSYEDLRYEAKLGPRAAGEIDKFRKGDDRQAGTTDDRTFTSLAELDSVPFVGHRAFEKLLAYARANGFVPAPTAAKTAFRVPLVDDDGALMDQFNEELATVGLDPFPRQVDVAEAADYEKWMEHANAASEKTGEYISLRAYGTPDDYVATVDGETIGICYVGEGKKIATLSTELTDNLFSDQWVLWGARYKDFVYTDEDDTDDSLAKLEKWAEWDTGSDAVLLVASTSDSGDDGTAYVIPPCKADLAVEATALALPVELQSIDSGFLGYMHVTVTGGELFTELANARTLAKGQELFGEACDGVPTSDDVAFTENASVASFVSFLRTGTEDWETTLSAPEVDALESFLTAVEPSTWRVFYGQDSGEVCGGSGTVSYNLIWNTKTSNVIYLILYPYSE